MKRLIYLLLFIPLISFGQVDPIVKPIVKPIVGQNISSAFCSQYQTVYDALTTKPDASIASAQNTMVKTLVDGGVWTKLDIFYVFAQTVNGDGEALRNWKNPGTFDATLVNAPPFVALEGFTGVPPDKYIRTNWNPATNGINLSLNDASIGCYIRNNVAEVKHDMGISSAANDYLRIASRWTNDNAYMSANDAGSSAGANTDSRGLFVISREANNILRGYRNKVQIINNAQASNVIPNGELYILIWNDLGGVESSCIRQLSMAFAGSAMTQADVNNLTDRFETYMDSNNKGVIESFPIILLCIIISRKRKQYEKIDCINTNPLSLAA